MRYEREGIKIITKEASIHGVHFGASKRPLIIMIHGMPGSMSDPLYAAAKKYFLEHGYSVFLFDLYGRRTGARTLKESTVAAWANDIDAIVGFFKKNGVRDIFVVGHSLGGPVILSSRKKRFAKAALWDPSYELSFTKPLRGTRPTLYLKRQHAYLVRWGKDLIVGEAMVQELDAFPWETIAKKFTRPFKVFIAGKGVLHAAKNYVRASPKGNEVMTIRGADHNFANTTHRNDLFEKTTEWFERK